MAMRCPTGPVLMPARRSTVASPKPGHTLGFGETRAPLAVIATGLGPNLTKYRGVTYVPGQQFQIDPLDAVALVKAGAITIPDTLPAPDWWGAPGRVLTREPGPAAVYAARQTAGALKIAQGTGYDPGNAVYRFHSAVNEHTKHASALVRYITRNNNPFNCPTQVDGIKEPALTRALCLGADVLHFHIDPILPVNVGLGVRPRPKQVVIRHYHGTQFTIDGKQVSDALQVVRQNAAFDDANGFVLVGARLTLCALRPGRMEWLPITVPVARYRAMVTRSPDEWPRTPFRIAHSPTKAILKGTRDFLMVCKRLRARGVPVEPVMIERKHHDAALVLKATCDACFDSFALGIQGSGLEAAAMGQPVIAGDANVAALYQAEIGSVPYTYAPTWQTLEQQIERLATDHAYYTSEAERVGAYVRDFHDYPAVARRYEGILAKALGREDVRTVVAERQKEKKKRPPRRVA